jgi:Zn-dependent M16 (insulinase) family peptidase
MEFPHVSMLHHNLLAEFFLAQKMFCIKIKDDKELEQTLRKERNFLIRRFLNHLIENQKENLR